MNQIYKSHKEDEDAASPNLNSDDVAADVPGSVGSGGGAVLTGESVVRHISPTVLYTSMQLYS